jgi:hypothetical protein
VERYLKMVIGKRLIEKSTFKDATGLPIEMRIGVILN